MSSEHDPIATRSSVLEGLLLFVIVLVVGESVDIQTHVPGDATLSTRLGKTGLRVDNRVSTLGGLDKLWVLLLENGKVLLRFPIPDAVRGEQKIHLLKSTLVGLGIQAVDHGQRNDVGNTKNIICLLRQGLEDDGKYEREPAITNGPAHNTPSVTLSTHFQWEDLSGVEPRDSEPGGTKSGGEEKDHSNGTRTVASSERRSSWVLETSSRQTASEEHGNPLYDGTPVQGPAATNLVQGKDTDEGSKLELVSVQISCHAMGAYHVGDGIQSRNPLHL